MIWMQKVKLYITRKKVLPREALSELITTVINSNIKSTEKISVNHKANKGIVIDFVSVSVGTYERVSFQLLMKGFTIKPLNY